MSDINITALIAQMPYVQTMANTHVLMPEAQQYFASHMAQQVFKQQQEQVQKAEKQDASQAVRNERESRQNSGSRQQAQGRRPAPKEIEEETPSDDAASPWIGHLVNKKV
ncbi:hypothetical protein [Fundidesulfovibrio butyratiphilus]